MNVSSLRAQLRSCSSIGWLSLSLLALSACGGGGSSTVVTSTTPVPGSSPPVQAGAPTLSLTLPPTTLIGQVVIVPAGSVSITAPSGLRTTGTFTVGATGPGYTFNTTATATEGGCAVNATACSTFAIPVAIGSSAFPGAYTVTLTVFDQQGRSATATACTTVIRTAGDPNVCPR